MNRYEWTYGRHSHEDWGTHDDLKVPPKALISIDIGLNDE